MEQLSIQINSMEDAVRGTCRLEERHTGPRKSLCCKGLVRDTAKDSAGSRKAPGSTDRKQASPGTDHAL